MSDWKAGFKRAVIDAIVAGGMPVRANPSRFGWEDYDRARDIKSAIAYQGIDYTRSTYRESCWDEFMGTFYQGDTRVYGVDATIVLRGAHEIGDPPGRSYHFRWKGTASDLIQAVLSEG